MKVETLSKRIEKSRAALRRNSPSFDRALKVVTSGYSRVNYLTGTGRYTQLVQTMAHLFIEEWGIDYEWINDAPRGGKIGSAIILTAKGRRQVKAYAEHIETLRAEERAAQEAQERAAQEARQRAAARVTAEVEALPIDTQLREEWAQAGAMTGKAKGDARVAAVSAFAVRAKVRFVADFWAILRELKNYLK